MGRLLDADRAPRNPAEMGRAPLHEYARNLVEETGVTAMEPAHPLAAVGLDMLARAACRLRPDGAALTDAGAGAGGETWTFDDVNRMTATFGGWLHDFGLAPGARIVIVGVGRSGAILAILGAIGAGFEPIVVPPSLDARAIGDLANASGAVAIAGPTEFGALDGERLLFEAAALAQDVRIVATFGPGASDGALDLSPRVLARSSPGADHRDGAPSRPRIGFVSGSATPRAHFVAQSRLVERGLDLVRSMRFEPGVPILGLMGPASMGGLIGGPIAALLAGLELVQFGPFQAAGLAALLERRGRVHLLAPAAILPRLRHARLLDEGVLAGLLLVERIEDRLTTADVDAIGCQCQRLPAMPGESPPGAVEAGAGGPHVMGSDIRHARSAG
jgi:hypothetical protein